MEHKFYNFINDIRHPADNHTRTLEHLEDLSTRQTASDSGFCAQYAYTRTIYISICVCVACIKSEVATDDLSLRSGVAYSLWGPNIWRCLVLRGLDFCNFVYTSMYLCVHIAPACAVIALWIIKIHTKYSECVASGNL